MSPGEVLFHLDFISPYSYLALARAPELEREHGIAFRMRPVVFGKLLEATGLVGPVEVEAKRRYTLADVVRLASAAGVPLVGPPAHPFRSLSALRVLALFADDPRALTLACSIARDIWAEGRDGESWDVLAEATRRAELDATDLEERATEPANKEWLRRFTEQALEDGVFGVPTFAVGGELFWGHDRMDALADRVSGRAAPLDAARIEQILARPIGVRRR